MIEVKRAVYPSPEQWDIVVSGCRNAYKSYEKRDSILISKRFINSPVYVKEYRFDGRYKPYYKTCFGEEQMKKVCDSEEYKILWANGEDVNAFYLGKSDRRLLKNLCNAQCGEPSHSKFLRQLPVILNIKAPLYWWKQMDKYQIGTVTNSESTMHTITKKEFTLDDFSLEHFKQLDDISKPTESLSDVIFGVDTMDGEECFNNTVISLLNDLRDEYLEDKDKKYWHAIIELLPESYLQTRTWSGNYEVLRKIVKQRQGHPLKGEWQVFIDWIRENVPLARELIFNEWTDGNQE